GLINTHLHSILLRGAADDLHLSQWLEDYVNPMHKAETPADRYAAALLCYADAIRSGTTSILDMSFRDMDKCAEAASLLGSRVVLAPYVTDISPHDYFETVGGNEALLQKF